MFKTQLFTFFSLIYVQAIRFRCLHKVISNKCYVVLCLYNYYRFLDNTVRESLQIVAADARSNFSLLGSDRQFQSTRPLG